MAANPDDPWADSDADDFKANQRRRKLIGAGIAVVVIAGIGTVVAIQQANKLPTLDPKDVADVTEALDQIPPEHRQDLAAAALVELEGGRLPPALLEPFEQINRVPPGMDDVVLLAPFAENAEALAAWQLACPNGAAVLGDAARSGEGTKFVHEQCELGRLGLLGDKELGGVSIGRLVATHAVWAFLVEHDSETDIERRVLRAILGRKS